MEMVVAFCVLGALALFLIWKFGPSGLLGESEQGRTGLGMYAKVLYGQRRLDELQVAVQLFVGQYGALPGDYPGPDLGPDHGNGNGRVERTRGEHVLAMRHLHLAGQLPNETPLFLKRPLELAWVEGGVFGQPGGGHFFVAREVSRPLAVQLDRRVDDGGAATGRIRYRDLGAAYRVDLYAELR
jgi:hypothetical protein